MVLRFRRSIGTERQQMKWVVAGVLIWLATFAAEPRAVRGRRQLTRDPPLRPVHRPLPGGDGPRDPALPPLRRRPGDPKTLVYACLVAVLGAMYLGGIALLGSLSASATGQSNEVAATITTLVVALAFQPLRRRIQHAIDRRFSRRTVDAETALRAFSGRLREEIDLDALCGELTGVVEHTFQPRHTSLWLQAP